MSESPPSTNVDEEKAAVNHQETIFNKGDLLTHHDSKELIGFDADIASVPEGYFKSVGLWGSLTAIGLSFGSAVGQFALPAAILDIINADIGPDPNIAWVSYIAVLGIAVGLPITARYSDIFGRRWFLVIEQFIMLVGAIVAATSENVPWLIGGTAIMSVFSGGAYSYSFLINELLPMKYRFMGTAWGICFAVPFSGFAPEIATNLATKPHGGWRWCYWMMAILNGLSTLLLFLFYYPPSFKMKHSRKSKSQTFKEIDVVGILIFTAGITVFILGLSWGGASYPWKSAAVIVSIVGGFLTIIVFVLWEGFARLKQPFMPLHLFKDRGWIVGTLLLSFGASIYYAFALVWPQAVVAVYSDGEENLRGILSCAAGIPYNAGQVLGGALCKKITKLKWQVFVATGLGTVFLGSLAAIGPNDRSAALGILIVGVFGMGWNEGVVQTLVGICVRDQKEIGVAVGIAGAVRSVISTIWSSVFVTVLNNRLKTTVPAQVAPAAITAGLPQNSVPALLAAFSAGTPTAFNGINGLTPEILATARSAYKEGSIEAYHTVFLVSIAVGTSLAILSLFAPNVDHLMNDKIGITIHRKRDERSLEQQAQK